jgi:hypothetical protein
MPSFKVGDRIESNLDDLFETEPYKATIKYLTSHLYGARLHVVRDDGRQGIGYSDGTWSICTFSGRKGTYVRRIK